MAYLTAGDRTYLEHILGMSGGYVLNFTDDTFGQLFRRHGIDIHSSRYFDYGTSKAKEMRAFWDKEPNLLVGKVLSEMLDVYEAMSQSGSGKMESEPYKKCRKIVAKLCGEVQDVDPTPEGEFSPSEFKMPDIQKLPVDRTVYRISQERLDEARRCLSAEAYLSAVIMCGSVLEAVLLGAAKRHPKKFNLSKVSPKKDGKVQPFSKWNLANLIDVARDVGLLKADAQSFSHGLRDFRNYIHPAKQDALNFAPRKQTARLCLNALEVALADISEGI